MFKKPISHKAEQFVESVIREMTRLALEHDAVNLSQGFPDFPAPDVLKKAAAEAVLADINQYAITWGAKNFRDALVEKTKRFMGIDIDPEREITVACGSTEAMIDVLLAVINTGDEVIVFEPFYENYGPDAILAGAVPRYVTLHEPDWTFDPDSLASAFNSRTRAIIVNSPNNPTGKVFNRNELTAIAELCLKWNVLAITDEFYEHIIYDDVEHIPMATLDGMSDRTITISGASKTFAVTGWRIGTTVAHPVLSDAIRKVHDFLTVGAAAPLQEGVADGLEMLPDSYYAELGDLYGRKRDLFYPALIEAGFKCYKPEGAYYVLADFSDLSDLPDDEFSFWLTSEIGVAPVPGSSFYSDPQDGRHLARFAFCKTEDLLEEAAERLITIRSRI